MDQDICDVCGAAGGGLPGACLVPVAIAQCALATVAGIGRGRRGGHRRYAGHRACFGNLWLDELLAVATMDDCSCDGPVHGRASHSS